LSFRANPCNKILSLFSEFTIRCLILFFKNSNPVAAQKKKFKKLGYLFPV